MLQRDPFLVERSIIAAVAEFQVSHQSLLQRQNRATTDEEMVPVQKNGKFVGSIAKLARRPAPAV